MEENNDKYFKFLSPSKNQALCSGKSGVRLLKHNISYLEIQITPYSQSSLGFWSF